MMKERIDLPPLSKPGFPPPPSNVSPQAYGYQQQPYGYSAPQQQLLQQIQKHKPPQQQQVQQQQVQPPQSRPPQPQPVPQVAKAPPPLIKQALPPINTSKPPLPPGVKAPPPAPKW